MVILTIVCALCALAVWCALRVGAMADRRGEE